MVGNCNLLQGRLTKETTEGNGRKRGRERSILKV